MPILLPMGPLLLPPALPPAVLNTHNANTSPGCLPALLQTTSPEQDRQVQEAGLLGGSLANTVMPPMPPPPQAGLYTQGPG